MDSNRTERTDTMTDKTRTSIADALERNRRDLARAAELRAKGGSLYTVAVMVGRSKEWLRANGIS
jgi:hypothetical protein